MTEDAGRAGAVDVAALRAKHHQVPGYEQCWACNQYWPCPTIHLLDALATAEQQAAYWERNFRVMGCAHDQALAAMEQIEQERAAAEALTREAERDRALWAERHGQVCQELDAARAALAALTAAGWAALPFVNATDGEAAACARARLEEALARPAPPAAP